MVHIGVFTVDRTERTGTDGAHGKGTDTVGTAHIELVYIGGCRAVAITVDDAAKQARGQMHVFSKLESFVSLSREFHILGKGIAKQLFVLFIELFAGHGVNG